MNADGQRFHLLLGRADWGRCAMPDGETLDHVWKREALSPPEPLPADAPGWDEERAQLTLAPLAELIPATRGDIVLTPDVRRAAAADRNGNIYWIGPDPTELRVRSAGDVSVTRFWPDARAARPVHATFGPADATPAKPASYRALAATDDGWLVAAHDKGFDSFDLVAGGPPLSFTWPATGAPKVTDLEPRCAGGLWLLDGAARMLFALDRTLTLTSPYDAPRPELFQPLTGEARTTRAAPAPTGHDLTVLAADINPIAIAALDDGQVAILSRNPDLLFVWSPDGNHPAPVEIDMVPHDLVAGTVMMRGGESATRVLVSGGTGNQARAFRLVSDPVLRIDPQFEEIYPLRRYGGLALVSVAGAAYYDSGTIPRWTPIVEKPRRRYAARAVFVSPRFDSSLPGAIWDRLRIDGCVPPGATLAIEARGGDDPADLGDWRTQPAPILVTSGTDLAGHSSAAIAPTDIVARRGQFELLFQRIEGQYAEVRVTLASDGDVSPHLRALRASWPRVSWAERYLPAVYRQDPGPADFLERFLANMQGTTATIETRIAVAEALFDTRTAPLETLGWLAEWFDVALDPSWDEARRRAFIAHAVRFFGWRGTMKGVESALALAFGQDLSSTLFGDGSCTCDNAIRIVEAYRTRTLGRIGAGDASGTEEAPVLDPGLAERDRWVAWQAARRTPTSPSAMTTLPFLEVPAAYAANWAGFVASPGHDRTLWQRFLAGRYRRLRPLNLAHNSNWQSFGEVPLFDRDPPTAKSRADWAAFTGRLLAIDRTAHRFSVLLPVGPADATDVATLEERRRLASRIVALEKPAHTIFDIRFYFAMNRIGEARLGLDTTIGAGSRSAETLPAAILGRAYVGESFIGPDGPSTTPDRARLAC